MRFRDWATALAGLAAVAVAIFAVGGVLRWAQAIVAVLVAMSLGFAVVSRRAFSRVSPLIAILSIASGLTLIQLLPLPESLLSALSPTQWALREDGAALLGTSPGSTITSDLPATLGALVFFLTLLGVAQIALRMATSERGRYRIIASVAALCALASVITFVHKAFGLQSLYGIYEPQYAAPRMLGPLLNANSLACLTAFGAALAIGLAAYPRQPGWLRACWLLVPLGSLEIIREIVSRGGFLALAAGCLVTISILIGQRVGTQEPRRKKARFVSGALPIGIVAGCVVVLVIYLNAGNVERQLSNFSLDEISQSRSKFAAWGTATTLIEESPWLGVGRGAFEASFTRLHPASGISTYSHLENEYLQAVVDWGIPGALALALAGLWFAYVAIRRWRDGPLAAGALGALTVIAVQSNVDFGMEFLGLAAPVTAIAATLAYVPLREATSLRPVQIARGAHVVALLVGALLLMTAATTTLDEDRRVVRESPTIANVRASVARHPLDYYGYAIASELLDKGGDRRAIRLLNHAMLLHPTHPGLHRLAARMLFRDGFTSQSTIEYAAAIRSTVNPTKLVEEVLGRFSAEQSAAALPLDYSPPEVLVRTISELGRLDVATLWLQRVIEHRPKDTRACQQLADLAARGEVLASAIASQRCVQLIADYETRVTLAQMRARNNGHADVLRLLGDVESWQSRVDDKISAWLALCDAHTALGNVDEAKRCLRRLDASPDMRPERRNEILTRLEAMQKPLDIPGLPPATGSAATSP